MKKRIVLLGATGSIGENTLEVVAAHADKLEIVGVAARTNDQKLAEISRRFNIPHVALFDDAAFSRARAAAHTFAPGTFFYGGISGVCDLARLPKADLVLVAVVGAVGLQPTLAAIAAGKQLALANKETLVLGGKFVMAAAAAALVEIRPVDSEHNAVFQCLQGHPRAHVKRVVLTASGGAFRDLSPEALEHVQPADALKHPNWAMGPKVTVDSATLANKGLELIEAHWLFGLAASQLDAVLHPTSIVHALAEFVDGSMVAQLAPPSMTFPIQHALFYPDRREGIRSSLDLNRPMTLDFRPIDQGRYPCFALAKDSLNAGGTGAAIFNAANEIAVQAFLEGRVPFLAIPRIVSKTLETIPITDPSQLDAFIAADAEARRIATTLI